MTETGNLQGTERRISWADISPCEHIVQFYGNDSVLIGTLIDFIGGALMAGESAIVIATDHHLKALEQGMHESGVNVVSALVQGRYIALLADEAVRRFMGERLPDEKLFAEFVAKLVTRARRNGGRVRAFGEMVGVPWEKGNAAATIRLEQLWQELCKREEFSLFCAYPKAAFTKDSATSIREICEAHSMVI